MELSQNLKNFITQFEQAVLPRIKNNEVMTVYVSQATLQDKQVRELIGLRPGTLYGTFMGITIKAKPDMEVQVW